ncbi:CoA transferase [Chakrabartyella piscis]|uniref:CaiB/BaiF CoA transferase family protein n=1 Tax=Chakrabartyella piscis TaxID=2918914 RepID=UPI0029583901|nr:CoA transferase [Chakrabartyella piscis]
MAVLDGVTVIDFTQAYSGPFSTMQLADFGANVIKIERRGYGDQSREWEPLTESGESGYFAAGNRNKRGIALDLSKEEGVELAKALIQNADIVVENFKVGTMEKLGLGYEEVKKINPNIIYASLSGYGQYGPLSHLAAYDNIIQSMCGIQYATGFPDGIPTKVGPSIGDNLTGLNLAFGMIVAYYNRLKTGEGQRIDVAMFDALFGILEPAIICKSMYNIDTVRVGNEEPGALVPYGVYPCKDGYFSAGLASDAGWDRFCVAMGMPELENDPKYATNALRCQNLNEFREILLEFFGAHTKEELAEIFTANNIPNAPLRNMEDLVNLPHLQERDMLIPINDNCVGEYIAIGNPMHLSDTPPEYKYGSPRIGQHTDEVLAEMGISKEAIAELYANEVI